MIHIAVLDDRHFGLCTPNSVMRCSFATGDHQHLAQAVNVSQSYGIPASSRRKKVDPWRELGAHACSTENVPLNHPESPRSASSPRRGLDLHRKATHLESERRKLIELRELLHMPVSILPEHATHQGGERRLPRGAHAPLALQGPIGLTTGRRYHRFLAFPGGHPQASSEAIRHRRPVVLRAVQLSRVP